MAETLQTTPDSSIVTKKILSYYNTKIKAWALAEIAKGGGGGGFKAVEFVNNTLKFYMTEDKSDTPVEINLPEEQFLDQTETKFVDSFVWSSTLYPDSTNPNLDGKPVLVLAVKGDESISYSFVNLEDLIKVYQPVDTDTVNMTISGDEISADVKVSSKEGNAISVVTENGKQGLYVGATSSNTIFTTLANFEAGEIAGTLDTSADYVITDVSDNQTIDANFVANFQPDTINATIV